MFEKSTVIVQNRSLALNGLAFLGYRSAMLQFLERNVNECATSSMYDVVCSWWTRLILFSNG